MALDDRDYARRRTEAQLAKHYGIGQRRRGWTPYRDFSKRTPYRANLSRPTSRPTSGNHWIIALTAWLALLGLLWWLYR